MGWTGARRTEPFDSGAVGGSVRGEQVWGLCSLSSRPVCWSHKPFVSRAERVGNGGNSTAVMAPQANDGSVKKLAFHSMGTGGNWTGGVFHWLLFFYSCFVKPASFIKLQVALSSCLGHQLRAHTPPFVLRGHDLLRMWFCRRATEALGPMLFLRPRYLQEEASVEVVVLSSFFCSCRAKMAACFPGGGFFLPQSGKSLAGAVHFRESAWTGNMVQDSCSGGTGISIPSVLSGLSLSSVSEPWRWHVGSGGSFCGVCVSWSDNPPNPPSCFQRRTSQGGGVSVSAAILNASLALFEENAVVSTSNGSPQVEGILLDLPLQVKTSLGHGGAFRSSSCSFSALKKAGSTGSSGGGALLARSSFFITQSTFRSNSMGFCSCGGEHVPSSCTRKFLIRIFGRNNARSTPRF